MVLKIFDFLHRHALVRWTSLLVVTLVMLCSIMRLSYKEDIQDFLPLSETGRERLAVYQDISGMNRLVVIFENTEGADETVRMIQRFGEVLEEIDTAGLAGSMRMTFDYESISEAMDFVSRNTPLFLTASDYRRMDSLLALPDYIDTKLNEDFDALMFPTGGMTEQNIARDPLGLFTPVFEELWRTGEGSAFEMYDGYIFTADMKHAFVLLTSPFGSSETAGNGRLVSMLDGAIEKTKTDFPEMKAHVAGGPQIAVTAARQIIRDSILAISLASVLILALLFYAFRSFRSILLIGFSVLWGWLFALGCLALVHDNISMIAVGISSIIIGIAVNYPLHLISHLQHQPDIRETLREITKPLLVGNVTTVGAFLALVPLQSLSLRDLGLFASFLLVGTILFSLIWLPQLTPQTLRPQTPQARLGESQPPLGEETDPLPKQGSAKANPSPSMGKDFLPLKGVGFRRAVLGGASVLLLLTLVLGYFSLHVEFDSDVSNINYMTAQQKEDMKLFSSLSGKADGDSVSLYLLSSAKGIDDALALSESRQAVIDSLLDTGLARSHRGVSRFLPSKAEQQQRLRRWNEWLAGHPLLPFDLKTAAAKHDFAEDAFSDFEDIILSKHTIIPFDDFLPLTSDMLRTNISHAVEGKVTVAETLTVCKEDIKKVKEALPEAFDIGSLHSSFADTLSADFNYVGWFCSLIVFIFLWLSFRRRIELAIISFVPMAVSWIWILGFMALLGIKFNIVNIILATFIFGQGDDYTIFMTEGCISEYVHGKPVLASYKRSIFLSALIMFIGIGTLILAKHPALHSLAELTIIGMSSVVLMAYLIPPMLFKWTMKRFPKRFETL